MSEIDECRRGESPDGNAPAPELPFPVPQGRFDQKNEMFKRSIWDEQFQELRNRLYGAKTYGSDPGHRKIENALRNASWNIEWSYADGNSRSNAGLYAWEGLPEKIRVWAEQNGPVQADRYEMSRIVKKAARLFGADLVGITAVHPNWIYSHEFNVLTGGHYPIELPAGCSTAVVMAVSMDYEAMRSRFTGISGAAVGKGYSDMAVIANRLAIFIRGLGYRALPSGNDTALSIPLAMAAGLGEGSRMGLLVTEPFGPRVRLCKVFTDLPLAFDSYRPFGVEAFCRVCKKCASSCPSQAIPFGEMTREGPSSCNQSGIRKWYVNPEKCYGFWSRNRMDCANCIRVCVFNKPPGILHDTVRWFIKRTALFNRVFVRGDDLFGYDRPVDPENYWGK